MKDGIKRKGGWVKRGLYLQCQGGSLLAVVVGEGKIIRGEKLRELGR